MKDTMVLAVLNKLDGNGSHDANEVVAIPLCKEALDYCCSTSTVKNEFVSFWKATIFYDGPDINRKASFSLWVVFVHGQMRKTKKLTVSYDK